VAQTFPLNHRPGPRLAVADAALRELSDDWTVLCERTISGTSADFVLVHVEIGVVVANLDSGSSAACEAIDRMLVRERFSEYYPGPLRLASIDIPSSDAAAALDVIEAELAQVEPLELDPTWRDDLIELLLTPDDLSMAPVQPPVAPLGPPASPLSAHNRDRRQIVVSAFVRPPASWWPYAVAAAVMAAILVGERMLPVATSAIDVPPVVETVASAYAAAPDARNNGRTPNVIVPALYMEQPPQIPVLSSIRPPTPYRGAPPVILPALYMQQPPRFPVLVSIRPLPLFRVIDCTGRRTKPPAVCLRGTPLRSLAELSGRPRGIRIAVGGYEPE
jgi:hypothetical protein